MVLSIFLGLIASVLIFFSLKERIRLKRYRKEWDVIGESKNSALSESLAGLVGTAGGIYLSLVMLTTFLEVDVPTRVNVSTVSIEPMAAISFLLAIASPYINRFLIGLKRLKLRFR
ncbi:hypothetical protein [Desulforamulus aquiferis]|uniref:MotA/TolQ/ExbB proton channel domain-containing protein n=1 Tax=Desulforamulus aquiferis TaxID=1397668 RepID=A0AAW7ZE13_9FIRM|nr:hypothetical protein [Desulforamulus aquiferis]MDO7787479.1 hypothetical protein [Desulforamulus aquiferis]RYD06795.1 hypothetical protein N752_02345 [Desulforamulus aquiferis]